MISIFENKIIDEILTSKIISSIPVLYFVQLRHISSKSHLTLYKVMYSNFVNFSRIVWKHIGLRIMVE